MPHLHAQADVADVRAGVAADEAVADGACRQGAQQAAELQPRDAERRVCALDALQWIPCAHMVRISTVAHARYILAPTQQPIM